MDGVTKNAEIRLRTRLDCARAIDGQVVNRSDNTLRARRHKRE